MFWRICIYAAMTVFVGLLSIPALAQNVPRCAPFKQVEARLQDKYHEHVSGMGIIPNGTLLSIWTGEDGTWTVTMSDAAGKTCLMAAGKDWTVIKPPKEPGT